MQKNHRFEQYQDMIGRLFPKEISTDVDGTKVLSRTVTFQVSDDCNLKCSYCYQCNKGNRSMNFEDAKKLINKLLSNDLNNYITTDKSPAIILEFIGGEPFLEVELIDKIVDYFRLQTILINHPWATRFMISICSNGVLHFDKRVQAFLNKNKSVLSYSITIDGNKELHDSCRVFHDGRPSYDIAVKGAMDWIEKGGYMGSKITIAPANVAYLYDAIVHMIKLGYNEINANCVYEKGWEQKHSIELYHQLKRIADYFIENNLVESHFCSLFEENFFKPKAEDDIDNWCGGTGAMLSMDPDGYLYPCIRYMESSLGENVEPYRIGHIDTGIGTNIDEQNRLKCMNCITRKTQSTEECFSCPIADGCSWCSALNYQENGTPNSRVTYICEMHKARSLANAYLWNKYYLKNNKKKCFKIYCPENWANKIIGNKEYLYLKDLEKQTEGQIYETNTSR